MIYNLVFVDEKNNIKHIVTPVAAVFENEVDAENYKSLLKLTRVPPRHVLCNETGERWKTLKEAAQAHNLAESALSNHLNGKPGHKTVKGRTYRRVV